MFKSSGHCSEYKGKGDKPVSYTHLTNEFNCKSENIAAITDSLDLGGGLYGKTGTGQIDGKTVNGWFNGVFESGGKVYGFSCRIESDNGADGARAADIAQEILSKDFS